MPALEPVKHTPKNRTPDPQRSGKTPDHPSGNSPSLQVLARSRPRRVFQRAPIFMCRHSLCQEYFRVFFNPEGIYPPANGAERLRQRAALPAGHAPLAHFLARYHLAPEGAGNGWPEVGEGLPLVSRPHGNNPKVGCIHRPASHPETTFGNHSKLPAACDELSSDRERS
jgi:hypothetical protein